MFTNEDRARLDALPAAVSAKGGVRPEAILFVSANAPSIRIVITWWDDSADYEHHRYNKQRCVAADFETAAESLSEVEAKIAALPEKAEREREVFLAKVSEAIETGRQFGIDVAFVNPLVEAMKRLSENALTDQSAK